MRPDDGPDQARTEVLQALKDLGGKVDGVYCADDGLAAGAVAALKTAGLSPLSPVTGRGTSWLPSRASWPGISS